LLPANSGWTLYDAFDINDLGQIVGAGTHNGITRGFVLTPLTRTRIQAFPSIAHVGGAGARLFLKFDAVLKTDSGRPVVGKAIDFVVGGSVACSGVTDEVGEATCGGLQAGVPQSVLTRGYVARFGGGPGYQASSAHGPILTVLDTSIS
jgi:hypothetical protein